MKVCMLSLFCVVLIQSLFATDEGRRRPRRTLSKEVSRIIREVNDYTHIETSSVERDVHEVGGVIRADSLANHLETRRVCQVEDHVVKREQEEAHNTTRHLVKQNQEYTSRHLASFSNMSRLMQLTISSKLNMIQQTLSQYRQLIFGQHNESQNINSQIYSNALG